MRVFTLEFASLGQRPKRDLWTEQFSFRPLDLLTALQGTRESLRCLTWLAHLAQIGDSVGDGVATWELNSVASRLFHKSRAVDS